MKKQICLLCLTTIFVISSCGQQKINDLIKENLKSRYTNIEIVNITPDSCPDMRDLFSRSLSMRIIESECNLNIVKAFVQYSKSEISFDKTSELCKKELEKVDALAKNWNKAYNSKSEKCLLVKYRYSNSDGIKTTITDYYSLDESRYEEGNYPYLNKEFDESYGFNIYKDVANKYKELLLEMATE